MDKKMKPEAQADPSVAANWKQSRRLLAEGLKDDDSIDSCDSVFGLEDRVLREPIRTLDDVLAKLSAVELAFVEGERSDGADAQALKQSIRWLRANWLARVSPSPSD